jgi:serine/threonine-protein kinase
MAVHATLTTSVDQPTLLWKATGRTSQQVSGGTADEDRMRELVGRELGVYRCESLLGRGGMGWVFLARHGDLDRPCALKILAPRLLDEDRAYLDRFQNEGRAAAALVHPNIVTTHAIGREEGLHFLEMEFVAGRALQATIDATPLTPLRATTLAAQIAAGLSAAHRAGILHRDLKPDNVLLTHRGVPKIGDFGLAKKVVLKQAGAFSEELAGTPNFMAPELFSGVPASPASDVYALGVCYFLMLTRRLPFARPRLRDLIDAATNETVPNVRELNPEVPLEMAECVALLMSRIPENRPRDATEAMQYLQAVLGQARDIETLLDEALGDEPNAAWRPTPAGHEVIVSLPDGRRQTVRVEHSSHAGADRLLLIYSACCPADPGHYEAALRINAEVFHGALALREVNGRPYFVMINTYPRATVDAEEIRRSVLEIALHADDFERRLTGDDQH